MATTVLSEEGFVSEGSDFGGGYFGVGVGIGDGDGDDYGGGGGSVAAPPASVTSLDDSLCRTGSPPSPRPPSPQPVEAPTRGAEPSEGASSGGGAGAPEGLRHTDGGGAGGGDGADSSDGSNSGSSTWASRAWASTCWEAAPGQPQTHLPSSSPEAVLAAAAARAGPSALDSCAKAPLTPRCGCNHTPPHVPRTRQHVVTNVYWI